MEDVLILRIKKYRKVKGIPIQVSEEEPLLKEGRTAATLSHGVKNRNIVETGTLEVVVHDKRLPNLDSYQNFLIKTPGYGHFPARCLKQSSTLFGNGTFELHFDIAFIGGFANHMLPLDPFSFLIVSKGKPDLNKWSLEEQRSLLTVLIDKFLPSRKEQLIPLIRKSYYLDYLAKEENGDLFLGRSRKKYEIQGKKRIHLGGFSTKFLKDYFDNSLLEAIKQIQFFTEDNDPEGWSVDMNESVIDRGPHGVEERVKVGINELLELPVLESVYISKLELTEDEEEQYDLLKETMEDFFHYGMDKILGYPQQYNCPLTQVVNKTKGVDAFAEIETEEADEWELLYKISPGREDLELSDSFGDWSLYFFILKKDLQAANFKSIEVFILL